MGAQKLHAEWFGRAQKVGTKIRSDAQIVEILILLIFWVTPIVNDLPSSAGKLHLVFKLSLELEA